MKFFNKLAAGPNINPARNLFDQQTDQEQARMARTNGSNRGNYNYNYDGGGRGNNIIRGGNNNNNDNRGNNIIRGGGGNGGNGNYNSGGGNGGYGFGFQGYNPAEQLGNNGFYGVRGSAGGIRRGTLDINMSQNAPRVNYVNPGEQGPVPQYQAPTANNRSYYNNNINTNTNTNSYYNNTVTNNTSQQQQPQTQPQPQQQQTQQVKEDNVKFEFIPGKRGENVTDKPKIPPAPELNYSAFHGLGKIDKATPAQIAQFKKDNQGYIDWYKANSANLPKNAIEIMGSTDGVIKKGVKDWNDPNNLNYQKNDLAKGRAQGLADMMVSTLGISKDHINPEFKLVVQKEGGSAAKFSDQSKRVATATLAPGLGGQDETKAWKDGTMSTSTLTLNGQKLDIPNNMGYTIKNTLENLPKDKQNEFLKSYATNLTKDKSGESFDWKAWGYDPKERASFNESKFQQEFATNLGKKYGKNGVEDYYQGDEIQLFGNDKGTSLKLNDGSGRIKPAQPTQPNQQTQQTQPNQQTQQTQPNTNAPGLNYNPFAMKPDANANSNVKVPFRPPEMFGGKTKDELDKMSPDQLKDWQSKNNTNSADGGLSPFQQYSQAANTGRDKGLDNTGQKNISGPNGAQPIPNAPLTSGQNTQKPEGAQPIPNAQNNATNMTFLPFGGVLPDLNKLKQQQQPKQYASYAKGNGTQYTNKSQFNQGNQDMQNLLDGAQ